MDDPRDAYKATTLRMLGSFQLLEFALKAYIGRAYSVIRSSVGEKLHFAHSAKDVEAFPLERLLNVFGKLNGNAELIDRLNRLKDDRNQLAHRSLLITMGAMYDRGAVEDRHNEYFWLEDELAECLTAVIGEAKGLKERSQSVA